MGLRWVGWGVRVSHPLDGGAAGERPRQQRRMGGAQQGARQAEQAALAGKQGQQLLHGVANEAVAGVGLGGCYALQGVVALQVGGGLLGALQGG